MLRPLGASPDPLTIRPPVPSDYLSWLALWDAYNAFYGRLGATALDLRITQTTWRRFFDESEPVHLLVGERGTELIGLAQYIFHRSTTSTGPTCYLQDLYTREDVREQGVGRRLIEGVCQRAKRAGSARVYWQTHETNLVARRLYERVAERSGFVIYRIRF